MKMKKVINENEGMVNYVSLLVLSLIVASASCDVVCWVPGTNKVDGVVHSEIRFYLLLF